MVGALVLLPWSNFSLPWRPSVVLALLLASGCGRTPDDVLPPADLSFLGSPVPDARHSSIWVSRTSGLVANGTDALEVVVVARNRANEPLPGIEVSGFLSTSGPPGRDNSSFPAVTDGAGKARGTLSTTLAGTRSVFATVSMPGEQPRVGTVIQAPDAVEFIAGPPAVLRFLNKLGAQMAGKVFSPLVSIKAEDAFGNDVPVHPTITLSLGGGPTGAQLSGPVQVEPGSGVANFPSAFLTMAGEGYVLEASSPGLPSVQSSPFSVLAAAPARMAFLVEPTDVVAGEPLPDLRVAHYDAFGNLATSAFNFVELHLLPERFDAPLFGERSESVRSGVAEFRGLTIRRAGLGYQLQARHDPLPPISSRTFNVLAAAPSAERSKLEAVPERVLADGSAPSSLVLRVRDPFDNPVPNAAVQFAVTHGQGALIETAAHSNARGTASAKLTSGQQGRVTVSAQVGGATVQQDVRFASARALQVGLPGLPNAPFGPSLVADFDGDGHLDIADIDNGGVLVARGVGDGTFSRPQSFHGYGMTYALATGDVNGDGVLDLVLGSSSISVLHGAGDGTFDSPTVYPADASTIHIGWVGVSDVNADGLSDVLYMLTSGLGVMINKGAGRLGPTTVWSAPRPSTSGTSSGQPQLLDVDGDGRLDLLVLDYYGEAVRVLRASAAGGFLPAAESYDVGSDPQDVAVGDVNGDGRLDLLVLRYFGTPALLRGLPNGTFGVAETVAATVPLGGSRLALGDVDGDGDLDLAVTTAHVGGVTVVRNDGAGGFVQAVSYAEGQERGTLRFADLTHDARPELLMSNGSVLLNAGDGKLHAPVGQHSSWNVARLLVADWNADGELDIVTAGAIAGVSWGAPGGGFAPYTSVSTLTSTDAASADFNGDGKLELVLGRDFGKRLDFFQVDSLGSVQSLPALPLGWTPTALHAAELDGDGVVDLAVASRGENAVRVLRNLGAGAFDISVAYPAGSSPTGLTTADLNGDGRRDLVVTHATTRDLSVLLAQPAGGYAPAVAIEAGRTMGVVAADLNGDGNVDLAAGVVAGNQSALVIFPGNGDGTFGPPLEHPLSSWATGVLASDLNGDGHVDLLAVGGKLTLFFGDGDGRFAPPVSYGSELEVVAAALADFNADGRIDVAAQLEALDSQSAVLFNRSLR